MSYVWDMIGNLLSRDDTVNGVAENFCYNDNADGSKNVLNRLSGYSVGRTDCTNGSLGWWTRCLHELLWSLSHAGIGRNRGERMRPRAGLAVGLRPRRARAGGTPTAT